MAFTKTEQYNAYNMATQTVPKTRQVVMLYDGAIRFSQQALKAMEENRIEDRFNLLNKVSEILMGLQSALDFDNGGEIAPLLFDYYSSLDSRILYIQRKNDAKILQSVIDELKKMREAWGNVDSRNLSESSDEKTTTEQASQQAQMAQQAPEVTQPKPPVTANEIDRSVFVSA
jgi:flagellar protein FliS